MVEPAPAKYCASSRRQYQHQVTLRVGADNVMLTASVHDIGIFMWTMMWTHVSRTVSGCFAILCQLHSIRRLMSQAVGTTVAGRLAGAVAAGLWQSDVHWSTWQPAAQSTVCDECRCMTCLLCAVIQSHHPTTP